jgi:two-component system, oxyanion-binding sensor
MIGLHPVSAAFMPLTDSAILLVATHLGFAEDEGVALKLTRETSWANVRDRMAVGHFDVAHMLAPMPVAFNLGLSPLALNVVAPMALGLGGNAITVSKNLHDEMQKSHNFNVLEPDTAGRALKMVIEATQKQKRRKLTFAVVHPHSVHNFELRYWLAACGIRPELDVDIVVVPPPLMPDALAADRIDGFCVGEPWNSVAAQKGHGAIATVKAAIWRSSPEKVLGVRQNWADQNPGVLGALLRAMVKAAEWCGNAENHHRLATLLALPEHINQPAYLIEAGLAGRLINAGESAIVVNDFFVAFDRAATFPWQSHALWLYTQMVRWGHISHSIENAELARLSYRPDLYRAALKPLEVALPGANSKVEGALLSPTPVGASGSGLVLGPDGFFDGQIFDPSKLDSYLAKQGALF